MCKLHLKKEKKTKQGQKKKERRQRAKKIPRKKRCLDLLGSLLGLIILSPLFMLLCCVIKAVSPGPAIYRQTRIGMGGRPFTFLKFRTMAINADTNNHREYLSSLINGDKDEQNCAQAMSKLDDNDHNIIIFKRFYPAYKMPIHAIMIQFRTFNHY